jgi:transcriptional regulator with XRE-family HTH domain
VRKKVLNDGLDIRIGYNLKQARKDSNINISQNDIAKLLNVQQGQISRYEAGSDRISASSLFRVAIFYDKDINYFFRITKQLEME